MRGLLQWLFGNSRDPSRDWPPHVGQLPDFDLSRDAWGGLRFGDPPEAARFLGRPDAFRDQPARHWFVLDYQRSGFSLEFLHGEFDAMYVMIGIDGEFHRQPTDPMARPRLSNGEVLTDTSTPEQIIRCFGEPDLIDSPEDEFFDEESVMLTYDDRPLGMEFEFNRRGHLVHWHIWRNRSES